MTTNGARAVVPQNPAPLRERDFIDYVRSMRRGWWIILISAVAVAGAAVGVSFQQSTVYRATNEILIAPPSNPLSSSQPAVSAAYVPIEIQVLESPAVTRIVRPSLRSTSGITAEQVGATNIVELTAESANAARAARTVNAYARAYITLQHQRESRAVLQFSGQLQSKIVELDARIAALDATVASAAADSRAALATQSAPERSALVNQQALYRQKLDEQSFEAVVGQGRNEVLRAAVAPSSPVRPTPVRDGVLGFAFGLILGIVLAIVFDRANDTIRTREDLERAVSEHAAPVLGHVPTSTLKSRTGLRVTSLVAPTSRAAEAYRSLRTSIQFLGVQTIVNTLQITSPIAAEGKSTTAANLGVVMARAGQRVIILDCDLRRPRIHEYFDLPNDVGFTSVLLGHVPIEAALQNVRTDDDLHLTLMASGPIPPNPSELLASAAARRALQDLRSLADVVIVDSPPLLPVTDAAIVATMVDATLLVVMAGLTTRKSAQRAIERLAQVDAKLVGLVLNRTPVEFEYAYGYRAERGSQSVPFGPQARHEIRRESLGP